MRVACYARASSDRQAEKALSIPAQLKALKNYASEQGWQVVAEYVDEAESARTADRPRFKEMIAAARAKNKLFEAILVWKLSRFARNREDSIIYKSLLRKRGIQLISINEHIDDTPSGKLLEGMIEVVDEFYSDNLAQDVIRGMQEKSSKGYFCGGKVPYGYKVVKVMDGQVLRSKLEPDEMTAPIVRRIFGECLDGSGVKEIAKQFNEDVIPGPRGKTWCTTSIYQVLTNEAMMGTLVWGKRRKAKEPLVVRAENAWRPIVDGETFRRAQATLSSRGPKVVRPRSITSHYLLGGMMRCSACGASMVGHAAKSGRFFYYRCGNALRRGPKACPGTWLPKNRIEDFIIDKIKQYILTDENLTELIAVTNEEIKTLAESESERINMLDHQLQEVDSRLERLYDALETGKFAIDDLSPRIKRLTSKKAELKNVRQRAEHALEDKKLEIKDMQAMRHNINDLRSALCSASISEQKAFLRSFVRTIDVSNCEVTVNYMLPMPPEHEDKETIGVLAFIRNGRPYRIRTCDTLIKSQVLCQLS
jgi:site-specific DNA recombinase